MISSSRNKSRSQQRREAVQAGSKLPTFTGRAVKNPKARKGHKLYEVSVKAVDPHVHITTEAHKLVAAKAKADKIQIKEVASAAIIKALGRK